MAHTICKIEDDYCFANISDLTTPKKSHIKWTEVEDGLTTHDFNGLLLLCSHYTTFLDPSSTCFEMRIDHHFATQRLDRPDENMSSTTGIYAMKKGS